MFWLLFRAIPLGQLAAVALVVAALQFAGVDVVGAAYDWFVTTVEGIVLGLAP